MATAVRCNGCQAWMPSDLAACELCGQARPEHNPHLLKAKLDAHLYQMAEGTATEDRKLRESQKEEIRQGKRLGIQAETGDTGLSAYERSILDRNK